MQTVQNVVERSPPLDYFFQRELLQLLDVPVENEFEAVLQVVSLENMEKKARVDEKVIPAAPVAQMEVAHDRDFVTGRKG